MYSFSQAVTEGEKSQAFQLRYRVYCIEKQWLDPCRYPDREEKDEHDERSIIFLARNMHGKVVGTTRLIINHDNRHLPINTHPSVGRAYRTSNCLEISRFSIAPEERSGGEVYIGLIRMLFRETIRNYLDYENVFFCVEPRFLSIVNMLGFLFEPIAETAFWFGDYIVPSRQTPKSLDHTVKDRNPAYHSWLWRNPAHMGKDERMFNFIKAGRHSAPQSGKDSLHLKTSVSIA